MRREQHHTKAVEAKTASYTSDPIAVNGASKVTVSFQRSEHSAGSSTFSVDGSIDGGATWLAGLMLIQVAANSNAQTKIRVLASGSLSSNTKVYYAVDLENFAFTHIRVVSTITTDGQNDAAVLVES